MINILTSSLWLIGSFSNEAVCEGSSVIGSTEIQSRVEHISSAFHDDQFQRWRNEYADGSIFSAVSKTSEHPPTWAQVEKVLKGKRTIEFTEAVSRKIGAKAFQVEGNGSSTPERNQLLADRSLKLAEQSNANPDHISFAFVGASHAYDISIKAEDSIFASTLFVGVPLREEELETAQDDRYLIGNQMWFTMSILSRPDPALVRKRWQSSRSVQEPNFFVFMDAHLLDSRNQYDSFPAESLKDQGVKKVSVAVEGFFARKPMTLEEFQKAISTESIIESVNSQLQKMGKQLNVNGENAIKQFCPEGVCSMNPGLAGLMDLLNRIEEQGIEVEIHAIDTEEADSIFLAGKTLAAKIPVAATERKKRE